MQHRSIARDTPLARLGSIIADLSELIDRDFDGYVGRPLVITLVLARKN